MNDLRIAVVGAGLIGRAHAAVIGQTPGCVLAAIVDPSPVAATLAAEAGVPVRASLDELLARDRPDAVVLATPNALHLPQALACLAAGLPVLVEKPVAANVAEAQALVRAAGERGVPVLVGHHRAHSPLMARACEVVASGALGRLVAVSGSALFAKPAQYFVDGPWRREPGGGPILINLIHEVHNLRMLCGEIVAVQAMASNAVRGFPVEDTVVVSLRFASGVLGSFVLSDTAGSARSWEQTAGENPAYPRHDDEDCYLVAGTRGSLAVPTLRTRTYPEGSEPSWWTPFVASRLEVERADPLVRQMEHFVAVARGAVQPKVSARDGLANLRVTEAIAEAARSGRLVEIGAAP